jgi:deoxyhypusine synthase
MLPIAAMGEMKRLLAGARIDPKPITRETTLTQLVDGALLAYNGARLREACQLFTQHLLEDDVTIGLSVSGALTPAGLGMSCLIPLVEAGFVDWITSTGANLYHDTHFGIGLTMHRGRPDLDDVLLKQDEVVRIYDIVFDYRVLLDTDAFYRKILFAPQFQKEMGTAEFHYLIGEVVAERQKALGLQRRSPGAC